MGKSEIDNVQGFDKVLVKKEKLWVVRNFLSCGYSNILLLASHYQFNRTEYGIRSHL